MSDLAPDSLALARRIADLAEERRGSDIVLLDVRDLVDYTDFFVIVSGQSTRQNQAIAEHVVRTLKGDKKYAISKAGLDTGSWICLDMSDVVVHVFDPETRARYDLELLWADAPRASRREAVVEAAAAASGPRRRRRVVRKEAVVDADEGNAPESERPHEPPAEGSAAPAPVPVPRRARGRDVLAAGKPSKAPRKPAAKPAGKAAPRKAAAKSPKPPTKRRRPRHSR